MVTTVADNTLETNLLELTAMTFPVLLRSEYLFAVQAVFFGLQGSVIDGFGLLYFAV